MTEKCGLHGSLCVVSMGLCGWSLQVVSTGLQGWSLWVVSAGLCGWSPQVVSTGGLHRWFGGRGQGK